MRLSSPRSASKRATPPHATAEPSSSRTTRKTPSGPTNIGASRVGPMSASPSYSPRISSCCASVSSRTSALSNGSGPERIERGVEGDGRDLLPPAVLATDDERLVDVELDAVARAVRAIDGDRPLTVCEHGAQLAAIRPVRLEPGTTQELDHRARPVVLAAHHRVPGHAPDDVARERSGDDLRIAAEAVLEHAPRKCGVVVLGGQRSSR